MVNSLLQQANAAVEENLIEDQSEKQVGFTRTVAPEGKSIARLVSYIELGDQKQPDYKGKPKDDAPVAVMTFELMGKNYLREIEVDGKKVTVPTLHTEREKISRNEKSRFWKLFQKLAGDKAGTEIKHVSQCLGKAYIVEIKHRTSGEGDKKQKWPNLYSPEDGWRISPPTIVNPVDGEVTDVDVPEASTELSLLLQEAPTKEQWDSIYISGTRERTVGGETLEVSKNWAQLACLQASSFKGSKLEKLLTTSGKLNDLLQELAVYEKASPAKKKSSSIATKEADKVEALPETPEEGEEASKEATSAPTEAQPSEEVSAEAEADAALKELGLG